MTDTEILGKLQELHGCSREMVLHWCEHAAKNCKAMYRAGLDKAGEDKARMDWLEETLVSLSAMTTPDMSGARIVGQLRNPKNRVKRLF